MIGWSVRRLGFVALLVVGCGGAGGAEVVPPAPVAPPEPPPIATVRKIDRDALESIMKTGTGKPKFVNFWATWCGPCVAEIPNVKAQYEKYHERGFEVLGISLDNDRQAVERFIDAEDIPWPSLFNDDPKRAGWEHPMAVHYGIMAIPAAILVNQEGKVVTLEARGDALGEELAKLLGPAEEKPAADKKEQGSPK